MGRASIEWVQELAATLNDRTYCPEIRRGCGPRRPATGRRLGRMLARWAPQIAAWHRSRASNGPVEAINGLAKRVKPVAVGITNWTHWRVRVLLYAGRPYWTKLATITPPRRELPKSRSCAVAEVTDQGVVTYVLAPHPGP